LHREDFAVFDWSEYEGVVEVFVVGPGVLFFLPSRSVGNQCSQQLGGNRTSSSQVNLTWTDNSTDEIGFTFAFDTNSGLTNSTYVYAGGVNTASYSHTGRGAATVTSY